MKTHKGHPALSTKARKLQRSLAVAGVALMGATFGATAGQGPQPTICNRACWVARSAPAASQMAALSRAIIHHTASASDYTTDYNTGKAKVRGIQNVHMDANGWSDIGYHFIVSAGGHIYEGRLNSLSSLPRGAHDGSNDNSFGFNIMGNYADFTEGGGANQIPTTPSLNSLYDVIAWRMPSAWSPYGSGSYNGNTVGYLDGHRKVKATACPGNNIYNVHITSNYSGGNARNGVNTRKNGGGTQRARVCDFNGDGSTDIAVYNTVDGNWKIRNQGTYQWGLTGDGEIPVPGDYNGDRITDIAVYNPVTFTWKVRNVGTYGWGTPDEIPVPGDYNGDGITDIAVYNLTTGYWKIRNQGNYQWGLTSDGEIPVPGDYNGDGTTDIAVYSPVTMTWKIRNIGNFGWGLAGEVPMPGDYNGDGITDICTFNKNDGYWKVRNQNNYQWALAGDIPQPGDYNGDGITDIAVYSPSTFTWKIRNQSNIGWGVANDLALPLPYAIRRVYYP